MDEASETESRASGAPKNGSDEEAPDDGTVKFNPKSKKWSARVKVPQELVRFVVGAKGAMKRKLEEETGCRLVIPKKGGKMERSIAIMSTMSEESVNRCQERIQLIAMDARERAPYTHFVSLSMAVPEIQTAYKQFVETVLNDDELPESCKDEALFQDAGKLHLTLVMLSLLDSNERTLAAKALESIVEERVKKILDGKPLEAEVRNLEYMNDDPSRVRVLYAGVSSDKLQKVADTIAEGMGEAGYAPRRADVVKIHLTLMNARYAWEKGKEKTRIDATKLVEKYGDFNFGRVTISEVHVSSLDEPKDENGHYKVIGTVKL